MTEEICFTHKYNLNRNYQSRSVTKSNEGVLYTPQIFQAFIWSNAVSCQTQDTSFHRMLPLYCGIQSA